jgi:hypothetical protein
MNIKRKAKKAYSAAVLEEILEPLRKIARQHGYAIAVHGSLSKDIDLLAVPWVKKASSYEDLANAVCEVFNKYFEHACINGKFTEQPHGRISCAIVMASSPVFIDLSIIKPKETP